jgi:hypothetical protein
VNPELFYNIQMHPVGAPSNVMTVPVERTTEDGDDITFEQAVEIAKQRLTVGMTVEWVVVE